MYNANTKPRPATDFIVVHCAATKPNQDIGAADIDRWHRAQGWACIGYHYVIRRDGTLEDGREESRIGAHVQGYNTNSIGICMAGGIDLKGNPENNFTPEQFDTLATLLSWLKDTYPKAVIQGHRDFPKVAKACPSFDVRDWLKTISLVPTSRP